MADNAVREIIVDGVTRRVILESESCESKKSNEKKRDPSRRGRNGRSEESAGDVRSAHGEGGRDDDGVGGRQSARASRAGRALDGHGEGRREALRRATAGRPRNAPELPDRRCGALAERLGGRHEGSRAPVSEGAY